MHPRNHRSPTRSSHEGAALVVALAAVAVALVVGGEALGQASGYHIVGWNNLGMHCDDPDFAVFSILPPYNVVDAQVVDPTGHLVTNPAGLSVTYQAVADPTGSINSTSAGKTNFWSNVLALFGVSLGVDMGLAGANMPGAANVPQPMVFDPTYHRFEATGVPITPYDDAMAKNYYPLMRLAVRDAGGNVLATSDVVLPVSDEMNCNACHASGSVAAAKPPSGWVFDPDPVRDYRLNILKLHDDLQLSNPAYVAALGALGYSAAGLYPTVTVNNTAILCAHCHASNALAGTGISGIPQLTISVHSFHASVIDPTNGMTLDASTNRSACYRCHPGSTTRCLRGVMGNSVALDGTMDIQCQNCHGPMSAVGAAGRVGWLAEPNCQSCHTGTAVINSGAIRYTTVFSSPGVVRTAADPTFATTPNVPATPYSLYRYSSGHGALQCEACHGATHAEYPSSHVNDNIEATALQGHAGPIEECAACHNPVPSTTSGGPHGMHPVGQAWVGAHPDAVQSGGSTPCRNCHGTDYRGTVLSQAFSDRTISAFGTKTFWRGFQVGCYTCHNGPSNDSGNSNVPATVADLSAATGAGAPVAIALVASDPDGDTLALRVVSQPANGTVGVSGTTATYFPFPGFAGTDTFTYAAWDGSTDSNLGHVTVAVAGGACTLACSASAPATATQNTAIQFSGSATPANCNGTPTYLWDFGDGSATSTFQNPMHAYAATGTFTWTFTATVSSVSCTRTGSVTVSATSTCTLTCSASAPATATAGTAVFFSGTATPSNCTGTPTYMWNFGDGSPASTAQNPTHVYASAGTFNWTLTTSVNGVSCMRSGTITVTPVSGCSLVCSASVPATATTGQEIPFSATATPTGCTGTPAFAWAFGDGVISTDPVTTHTYQAAGTYAWTLTVTDGTATCSRSGTITVTAPAVCTVTCAAAVPTSAVLRTSVTFSGSATATNCSGTLAYHWTFGDGTSANGAKVTHTYGATGTYTWTLTVTDDDVTCTKSGTITITRRIRNQVTSE